MIAKSLENLIENGYESLLSEEDLFQSFLDGSLIFFLYIKGKGKGKGKGRERKGKGKGREEREERVQEEKK